MQPYPYADAIFATLKAIVDDETSTISSTISLRVARPYRMPGEVKDPTSRLYHSKKNSPPPQCDYAAENEEMNRVHCCCMDGEREREGEKGGREREGGRERGMVGERDGERERGIERDGERGEGDGESKGERVVRPHAV